MFNQGQHVLDAVHHEVHNAKHFTTVFANSIANDADLIMGMFIPTAIDPVHLVWTAGFNGSFEFKIREGVTLATSGTGINEFCNNRVIANSSGCGLFQGTTNSADGNLLYDGFIPGETGFFASGAHAGGRAEWIFPSSQWVTFTLTNKKGTADKGYIALEYYTHP